MPEDEPSSRPYKRLGFIGRFKPLHVGGERAIKGLLEQADEIVIGIGSANKYNMRNPFTADESRAMIEKTFADDLHRITIHTIDDYAHIPAYRDGKRWRTEIISRFGELDGFASGNAYVQELLGDHYAILPSFTFVPKADRIRVSSTDVRQRMAQGSDWQSLVPDAVAQYITTNKLDERFRREFGLKTLENSAVTTLTIDTYAAEAANAREA